MQENKKETELFPELTPCVGVQDQMNDYINHNNINMMQLHVGVTKKKKNKKSA